MLGPPFRSEHSRFLFNTEMCCGECSCVIFSPSARSMPIENVAAFRCYSAVCKRDVCACGSRDSSSCSGTGSGGPRYPISSVGFLLSALLYNFSPPHPRSSAFRGWRSVWYGSKSVQSVLVQLSLHPVLVLETHEHPWSRSDFIYGTVSEITD